MNQWEQAWLSYREKEKLSARGNAYLTGQIVTEGYENSSKQDMALRNSALEELIRASEGLDQKKGSWKLELSCLSENDYCELGEEGFAIREDTAAKVLTIQGSSKGILYGVYEMLRNVYSKEESEWSWRNVPEGEWDVHIPDNPLRMLNHWDNFDGSIERGYSGNSFFFRNGLVINERTKDYARLTASIGINGVVINNVNVRGEAVCLITERYFGQLRNLSELFAAYGIKLFLSVDFAASIDIGGLDSADPLREDVCRWWIEQAKKLYEAVPMFGGFLVKADSEGRPGPFTYNRTHADGANMLAEALAPYGGLVIWRCFVYNCQQDWRDLKTDRARAGYDNFQPLDGRFAENVILQIKNGPMDFQVREPVSPLFGSMPRTNQMLEVQIAQEYTGQQRHVCYLIPWFQEVLRFDTYCRQHEAGEVEDITTVAAIVQGRTWRYSANCGICAVANTGTDANWTGHDLAGANWYGFGRLAWDNNLTSEKIAAEWCTLTYGRNERVNAVVTDILMKSWPVYEKYNAPLGIGWMCNPNYHYGPNVDGYEYDRWGTYHRADCRGIGVDRSSRGTGYTSQYYEPNASMYNEPETCPEELLLFFHHMPYDYVLKTGKTIIQHIYDTHFEGAAAVEEMCTQWESLKNDIEPNAYERTRQRFEHQKQHSKEWCDVINSYFYRKTLISDKNKRTIY